MLRAGLDSRNGRSAAVAVFQRTVSTGSPAEPRPLAVPPEACARSAVASAAVKHARCGTATSLPTRQHLGENRGEKAGGGGGGVSISTLKGAIISHGDDRGDKSRSGQGSTHQAAARSSVCLLLAVDQRRSSMSALWHDVVTQAELGPP